MLTPDQLKEVLRAVQQYGAQAVYRAAEQQMGGAHHLQKVGITPAGLGHAVAVHAEAYRQLGPAAQAIDAAQARAKLDKP